MEIIKTIPRIRPTVTFKEIFLIMYNLFRSKNIGFQEVTISKFEEAFAARYDLPRGVCFSKARVAFYFLLKTMNLRPEGEVIISAIHVADFVNMIRLAGFRPVVVDLLPNNYTIDCEDLEKKINDNTVLMLITHLSGYVTDMDKIIEISKRRNVAVIEDCSQAISSQYNGRPLGVFGKAAIFSLSLLKPVCTLSGGMVLSSDTELLKKLQQERSRLQQPKKLPLISEAIKNIIIKIAVDTILFRWVTFSLIRLALSFGDYFSRYQKTNKTVILRKSMPSDFLVKFIWQQAVMGLSQLTTLKKREQERIENGLYVYARLKSHAHICLPPVTKWSLNSFWLFPVLVDDTDKMKRFLARAGIDSSKFLLSLLSGEEAFKEYNFQCVSAKQIRDHTLFIPMYCGISRDQLDYIVQVIKGYHD